MKSSESIKYRVELDFNGADRISGGAILQHLKIFFLYPGKDPVLYCSGVQNWMEYIRITSLHPHESEAVIVWNENDVDFVRRYVRALSYDDLAQGLKVERDRVRRKTHGERLNSYERNLFTEWEVQYILDHYKTCSFTDIAKVLGRSKKTVRCKFRRMKLKRTPEESEAIMRRSCKKSQFKKGHTPANTLHDGIVTIRNSKSKRGSQHSRKHIRLAHGEWQELQIHNWEAVNGPVPDGFILACIDGDPLNCDPVNWRLITKTQNLERNSGRKNLEDRYVKRMIAPRDKELQKQLSGYPELIKLKRAELKLKREINEKSE